MQAIIVGIVCLFLYGSFLCIRGMVRMYKEREIKLLLWTAAFFVLAPLLAWGALSLAEDNMNIWFALPILLFGITWLCIGYFVEAYLRKEKRRQLDGLKKVIPARPPNHLRNNLVLLAIAVAIWIYGATAGIANATVETCALCICMFLFARAVSSLWRYRGF